MVLQLLLGGVALVVNMRMAARGHVVSVRGHQVLFQLLPHQLLPHRQGWACAPTHAGGLTTVGVMMVDPAAIMACVTRGRIAKIVAHVTGE